MAHPSLPKHVEQICRRKGREWSDQCFNLVVTWLTATPGAPQPPLRFLLNLTYLLLGSGNVEDAPDTLQSFWYDGRNGFQMRVRGYYEPTDDVSPYFWRFLSGGLRQFCSRSRGAERKRQQSVVLDSETGRPQLVPLTTLPLDGAGAEGNSDALAIVDADRSRQPEQALLKDIYSERLQRAFDKLKPREQTVLLACLQDETDRKQTAQRLGMTESNLNVIFLRAKRLMRETMESECSPGKEAPKQRRDSDGR